MNNHLSNWEEDLRRRLADHRATPPAMGWEKLAQRLETVPQPAPSQPKHRPVLLRPAWLVSALSAAACATLVWLLMPGGDHTTNAPAPTALTSPATQQAQPHPAGTSLAKQTVATPGTGTIAGRNLTASALTSAAAATVSEVNREAATPALASEAPTIAATAPLIAQATPLEARAATGEVQPTHNEGEASRDKEAKDALSQGSTIHSKTHGDQSESPATKSVPYTARLRSRALAATSTARRNESNDRQIALAMQANALPGARSQSGGYAGSGFLLSAMTATPNSHESPQYADLTQLLFSNLNREVTTRVKHQTPLQLGLSVNIPLTGRWSLGTGLTYTRLATDITSGSDASYSLTEQRLHYVGIPVQVRFTALASRWADLYVSAGGMLEKCVYGVQTTSLYVNDFYKSQTSSDPQHVGRGLWQASLGASAGVQLNLTPSVGLYFEPGFTWYPSDGSSLYNIRHDKPCQFTMQGGLRLTLGR